MSFLKAPKAPKYWFLYYIIVGGGEVILAIGSDIVILGYIIYDANKCISSHNIVLLLLLQYHLIDFL